MRAFLCALVLVASCASVERQARAPESGTWSAWTATDASGVERPFQLFVPASVRAGATPTACLVHLHGAVSRPEYGQGLGTPQAVGYADILWRELAEANDWLLAAPQARADCAWWSKAGVAHVDATLARIAESFPIPDDAIFAAGFSDGASGCFYRAMTGPDPFAGFIALNGHPAVASRASGEQLYLENLQARPMIVGLTQEDSLYPSAKVLPHVTSAIQAGAKLTLLSFPDINHQPTYLKEQSRLLERFLAKTRLVPETDELDWRLADLAHGRVAGLDVLELDPGDAPLDTSANLSGAEGRAVYRRDEPTYRVQVRWTNEPEEHHVHLEAPGVASLRLRVPERYRAESTLRVHWSRDVDSASSEPQAVREFPVERDDDGAFVVVER